MKILTSENISYEMEYVPEEIDDIRYCVLDYSNKNDADYFFVPLVFLEIFNAPAAVLKIGEHLVKMPLDWSLIICEPDAGEPEIVPITSLNDRGFHAFTFNPISSIIPRFLDVDIVNIYQDVKWYFPRLKYGHILAVPLSDEPGSDCAFFVKEVSKVPEVLDTSNLW